ncbi:MAG: PTS sugar transporter subunit IIA [Kiritimatiellae bacterium]|jgi:PTS system nitrogen regulatory IIA component|nr:PTS sugar transporter subunit IIA [Kiritimatiellia bacterium]
MSHQILTLSKAARHICIPEKQLYHLALQHEIPCEKRGEQYFFKHRELDEWAQRRIMKLSPQQLQQHHKDVASANSMNLNNDYLIESILNIEQIHPYMEAKTKPAVIHKMVKAAAATDMLNDEEYLLAELTAREEIGSTAIGDGAALLHNRYFDPYTFTDSFIILARTVQPVFFGCQDGGKTDIFFLICCTNDDLHLHILARLCMLIHRTGLLQSLRDAESADEMYQELHTAECELLKSL